MEFRKIDINVSFSNTNFIHLKAYAMDAVNLLNQMRFEKNFFDVIDLDPYGSAIPFIESALGAL